MSSPLHSQQLVPAPLETKISLTFFSIALVDALGGPVEGKKRFSFPFHSQMEFNDFFGVPKGCWTDDTSMTLCLASSIATQPDFDERDQLRKYGEWYETGYMSSTENGQGFGIGLTTSQALAIYFKMESQECMRIMTAIREQLGGERMAGNGSLMRLAPVPLAYWRLGEEKVKECARRSSETTHPNPLCVEVCEMWALLLANVLKQSTNADSNIRWNKLDVLHWIAQYPWVHPALVESLLTLPRMLAPVPDDLSQRELFYQQHHPLLCLETVVTADCPFALPSKSDLESSGYVLHTLQAALYAFFATSTFEGGALLAVNLGDDADTVGAVYAALGGLWYGSQDANSEDKFWTRRVREWKAHLAKPDLLEMVAHNLHESMRSYSE
ncbi:ADP-ribosylation/Crystallin J1 [Flagelloscypha sp. PMI_526]|nr:ADP-ribosylation/Crystallin J1 [Flagelloscypha sp. PMI_526]